MKKVLGLLLAVLCIVTILSACSGSKTEKATESGNGDSSSKTEIVVFAAASMTETLEELSKTYTASHPDITITYNLDSSGTLKTQIEEGAVCDLFISAAQKQMNGLDEGGYINADTRINLSLIHI